MAEGARAENSPSKVVPPMLSLPLHGPRSANRFRRYLVKSGRDDLALSVIQYLCRILDPHKFGTVSQRIPNNVKPVGLRELLSLIPFVGGHYDVAAALAAFHLDAADLHLAGDFVQSLHRADVKAFAFVAGEAHVAHTNAVLVAEAFLLDQVADREIFGDDLGARISLS